VTVYYVNNNGGNDTNDGLTEGNAWATIQKAVDTVVANDYVYVKGGTTYTEAVSWAAAPAGASYVAPTIFEGYLSAPGDKGRVVITPASGSAMTMGNINTHTTWINFSFNNCTSVGFNGIAGADYIYFINCEFNNNNGSGLHAFNNIVLINCTAILNSGAGLVTANLAYMAGCDVRNNTGSGIQMNSGLVYRCLSTGNGINDTYSQIYNNSSNLKIFVGNTLDGGGVADGITANFNSFYTGVLDNIIVNSVSGIRVLGTTNVSTAEPIDYNLFYNNTLDIEANITHPEMNQYHGINADPLFIDDANDDYRVRQNSPLVGAGVKPGVYT
jgi:hypothetical protein